MHAHSMHTMSLLGMLVSVCILAVLAMETLKQEDSEFQANLDYVVRPHLKN